MKDLMRPMRISGGEIFNIKCITLFSTSSSKPTPAISIVAPANSKEQKMKYSTVLSKIFLSFFTIVVLFFTTGITLAQADSTPKNRLKNLSIVKGLVGGESHDSYVIRVRKNQTLKVQISWQEKNDSKAQFVVSKSADFFAGDLVEGGRETYDGKNWAGKINDTGDFYIYVTAHPTAKYTLKVSVK